MTHTIWIAESDNGSVQFDTCPSSSDVRNVCEGFDDLGGRINVYVVKTIETHRELLFSIDGDTDEENI